MFRHAPKSGVEIVVCRLLDSSPVIVLNALELAVTVVTSVEMVRNWIRNLFPFN